MQGVSFKHHSEGKGRLKRDPKKGSGFISTTLLFLCALRSFVGMMNLWYCTTLKPEDFTRISRLTTLFHFLLRETNPSNCKYFNPVLNSYTCLHRRHFSPKMLRLTQNSFAVYQKATVTLAGWRHACAFTAMLWHSHSIPIKYLSTYLFPLFGKHFYVEQSWSFKHPINV